LFRGFRKPKSPAFPCYGATTSEAGKRCATIRFSRRLASGQHNPLFEYRKSMARSRHPGCGRERGRAHSARRYQHIEAVFVFGGWLDHWFAASGQAKRRTRYIHNRKRNSNMKTTTRFVISRQSRAKLAAVALVALLGSALSVSDANAFSCGRSAFGGGCIGPRGAVGVNRNGAIAVGRYGNVYAYHRGSTCFWRNSQRICP
jgi:hypothetical protein